TVSLPQLIHQALTEPVGPRCEARSESGVGATGRPRGPKITPEPPPATIAERLVPPQRSRRPGPCPPVTMGGDMDTCPTERIAHSPVPRGTPSCGGVHVARAYHYGRFGGGGGQSGWYHGMHSRPSSGRECIFLVASRGCRPHMARAARASR